MFFFIFFVFITNGNFTCELAMYLKRDKNNSFGYQNDRLEIKRDKKGIVHVAGAIMRDVNSAGELSKVFHEGML